MNALLFGARMAAWRRESGLTQAELAARMDTTQSAVARVEAGRSLPSLPFLERFAKATGRATLTLTFDEPSTRAEDRRRRVRRVLGDYVFNPWDRSPTPAEARSLEADGLTRERFEGQRTPRAR